MARHLTGANIAAICEMLDGWDCAFPLTWENLAVAAEGLLRHRYTRQALNAHERIRAAYAVRRNLLKNQPERKVGPGAVELAALQGRLDRIRVENERLKAENERLLSQFARWVYNTSIHGLTQEDLNAALPRLDRERTRETVIEDIRRQRRKAKRS